MIFDKHKKHKEMRVDRKWVEDALRWLKANKHLYADIEIDQQRLDQLPLNGNFASMNCESVEVNDI